MCRDGQEASVATPAGRAACRARHSRAPWHRPRCWRGLSPGMVLAGSPPGSCLHLFLTLLGFSFLLLSIYCFIACSPPASLSRNAPLHKSLLVLLLRASGALLPARPVPKSPSTASASPLATLPIPNGLVWDALLSGSLHGAPRTQTCFLGAVVWAGLVPKRRTDAL